MSDTLTLSMCLSPPQGLWSVSNILLGRDFSHSLVGLPFLHCAAFGFGTVPEQKQRKMDLAVNHTCHNFSLICTIH